MVKKCNLKLLSPSTKSIGLSTFHTSLKVLGSDVAEGPFGLPQEPGLRCHCTSCTLYNDTPWQTKVLV